MLGIVNYIRGYIRVELTSDFPERFINICAHNGVGLWDAERVNAVTLHASMRRSDFKKMPPFASRGVGRIRLLGKHGLPFLLWRFRKRYALLAGLLITVSSLYALSQFIWEIDVAGSERIPQETILKELADIGVGIGSYRHGFDMVDVQNRMILRIPELEWLAVNTTGSHALVEVRERTPKPEIVPQDVPCNIVAAKPGLIHSIDTLAGSPQVTAGQTVEAGDLLVSGIIDSEMAGMMSVHALADVKARTWYEYTAVMSLRASGKAYTGRSATRYSLTLGGLRFNFYKNSSQIYAGCDKITKHTMLRVPPGIALPVVWTSETFTEYERTAYSQDVSGARGHLYGVLDAMLKDAIGGGGQIVSADFTETPGDGTLVCGLTAECLEPIAVTAPIP